MHITFWSENLKERQIGRPWCRCESKSRMDLSVLVWEVVDWINLDQDRDQWRALVNMVMNLRIR
jgi:hypothetical protein